MLRMARLPARSAWCAMVTVTPDVSRMRVLIAGRPNAGMISNEPSSRGPSCAGPLVGQAFSNSGCSSTLPMTLVPSPPSHGTDSARA